MDNINNYNPKTDKSNLHKNCRQCNALTLVTDSICNIAHLSKEDYYYSCNASVENDCNSNGSVYITAFKVEIKQR